jgi:hypothetical protein
MQMHSARQIVFTLDQCSGRLGRHVRLVCHCAGGGKRKEGARHGTFQRKAYTMKLVIVAVPGRPNAALQLVR